MKVLRIVVPFIAAYNVETGKANSREKFDFLRISVSKLNREKQDKILYCIYY